MLPRDLDPPDATVRLLAWVIAALVALGFGACIAEGANRPEDPQLVEARLPGFGEIAFKVSRPDGIVSTTEQCALLAATEQQRRQGLMQVTDLRGYAGMIFRYPADSQGAFHMRNTPMPLSIAFFDAGGRFVSAADMAPCDDRADCPTYAAAGPYRFALEVPQGQLAALGIGPGSVVELGGPCPGG